MDTDGGHCCLGPDTPVFAAERDKRFGSAHRTREPRPLPTPPVHPTRRVAERGRASTPVLRPSREATSVDWVDHRRSCGFTRWALAHGIWPRARCPALVHGAQAICSIEVPSTVAGRSSPAVLASLATLVYCSADGAAWLRIRRHHRLCRTRRMPSRSFGYRKHRLRLLGLVDLRLLRRFVRETCCL